MNSAPEISVTLDAGLFAHFCAESKRLGVPIEWILASLVVDTIEADWPEPAVA
jgi:hypothetical protein